VRGLARCLVGYDLCLDGNIYIVSMGLVGHNEMQATRERGLAYLS